MKNINCTQFNRGVCLHQAAPRRLFGRTKCLLVIQNEDPRAVNACALRVENIRPAPPGKPYVPQPQ